MKNRKKCLCCDAGLKFFLQYLSYKIFKCGVCGSAFVFPRDNCKNHLKLYSKDYYTEKPVFPRINEKLKEIFIYRYRIKHLQLTKRQGRVLDFGCGGGNFVSKFNKNNWKRYGLDISKVACNITKEKGIMVFCGYLSEAQYKANFFDIIIANHVIEHLKNPDGVIKELKRIMKLGGKIYIEVPSYNSFWSNLFGLQWPSNNDIPRHLSHFTKKGLTCLLEKNGYQKTKRVNNLVSDLLYTSYLMRMMFFRKTKNRFIATIMTLLVSPTVFLVSSIGNREALAIIFTKAKE